MCREVRSEGITFWIATPPGVTDKSSGVIALLAERYVEQAGELKRLSESLPFTDAELREALPIMDPEQ